MNRNLQCCFVVAFLLLVVSGCVREEVDGQTKTFTFERWIPLSIFTAGAAAAAIGWSIRHLSYRFGLFLVTMGAIAVLAFAPSMLLDRIEIDDAGLSTRTGIWLFPTEHRIEFQNLREVSFVLEERRSLRGRRSTSNFMLCEQSDGTTTEIPVNSHVARAAMAHFLPMVAERRIPISGHPTWNDAPQITQQMPSFSPQMSPAVERAYENIKRSREEHQERIQSLRTQTKPNGASFTPGDDIQTPGEDVHDFRTPTRPNVPSFAPGGDRQRFRGPQKLNGRSNRVRTLFAAGEVGDRNERHSTSLAKPPILRERRVE